MKDKKAAQVARKQQQKAALQTGIKRKSAETNFEAVEPTRVERQEILIVCEGVNTVPRYFREFRLTSCHIVALGTGDETIRVVEQTIKEQRNGQYDQVWVVQNRLIWVREDAAGTDTGEDEVFVENVEVKDKGDLEQL